MTGKVYLACIDFCVDYEGHDTKYFGSFSSKGDAEAVLERIMEDYGLAERAERYNDSYRVRSGVLDFYKMFGKGADSLFLYVQEVDAPPMNVHIAVFERDEKESEILGVYNSVDLARSRIYTHAKSIGFDVEAINANRYEVTNAHMINRDMPAFASDRYGYRIRTYPVQ